MTILWDQSSLEEDCVHCKYYQRLNVSYSEAKENQNRKAVNSFSHEQTHKSQRMHTCECTTKTCQKNIQLRNHNRQVMLNRQCYNVVKSEEENVIERSYQILLEKNTCLVNLLLRFFVTDRLAQPYGKAACQICLLRYHPCLKHNCSDHNSSSKHLCKCKLCRDKIGEFFSHIQKYLLFVHFTRREFGLLCGSVTCNVRRSHCIQHWPFKKCILPLSVNGNEPCTHLDLRYGNRLTNLIVCLPGFKCKGSGRPFVHIYSEIFLIMVFMVRLIFVCAVTLHTLSANSQDTAKKMFQRKFNIYLLSSVLILVSSRQTEHELSQKTKRENENILGVDTVTEILLYLQKRKSKTSKMILHDIIYHLSPSRNDVFAVYPVSRRGKEEMASELMRLGSLHNYPRDNTPSLIFLAKSGFYYEGKGREVVCFSCGITHADWSYDSKPNKVHYSISPECPYLKEYFSLSQTMLSASACGQIPFTAGDQTSSYLNIEADAIQPCTDAAGNLPPILLVSSSSNPRLVKSSIESGYFESSYNSRNVSGRSQQNTLLTSTSKDSGYSSGEASNSSYGIGLQNKQQTPVLGSETDRNFQTFEGNTEVQTQTTANTPKEKYPEYKLIERRRNTYKNWPSNLSFLHPLDLSECGFFYSNFGDCVRCFHCGIGLRNWEADDNPWVEHARWSRKCPYLLQKKGQGFIDSVLTVLGLQTDAEIEQQMNNAGSEKSSQAASEYGTASNDVQDPIQHRSAQYVLTEKIFGENKSRLVKMTMNQLLQAHDWDDITNDMLVNAVLEHKDGIEFMETRNNPTDLSESNSQSPTNLVSKDQMSTNLSSPTSANVTESNDSNIDNSEKIQKENEELKDLYTCKICLDERVGITFVPCGHLVTCKNCSPKIRRCPLCRTFIRGTIKTTL